MAGLPEFNPARSLWAELQTGMTRQRERLLSIPSELAIRGMHMPLATRRFAVEEARGNAAAPTGISTSLGQFDQAIVERLIQNGVCVTSLDALAFPDTGGMFEDAMSVAGALIERGRFAPTTGKHTLTATADDLLARMRVFRWALNDRLLDIVEAYLGAPAAYDGALVYLSRGDGREGGVRKWHRDREDDRMLKVAIYLNDVDEDGGPFQVLTPELQKLVDGRASWKYASMRDEQMSITIRDGDWATGVRTLTGARGTVFLVDTARCHHRGKPPTKRDRLAVFHSFFRRVPSHPFCCERSTLSREQMASFADSLPRRGRDCVLWREKLPWRMRLVPRNRMTI